jgi:hypothetical protein
MQTVPAGFNTEMHAARRRVLGKVVIDYTDPFLDQSVTVTTNEDAYIQHKTQTADSLLTPTRKFASLDGSWVLDGTYYLCPESPSDGQMGWWGSTLAGVGGVFGAPLPTLTVEFVARPIHALRVVGDSARGEYPVDFTVTLYDAVGGVLHTEAVVGNALVDWALDIDLVVDCTKMTLVISKWSHPGRQVKILEFYTSIQETYLGDDLVLVELTEEKEYTQASLPIGNIASAEVEVRLDNTHNRFKPGNTQSPLYGLLKRNRRVRPYLGAVVGGQTVWVPLGVFWTLDWDAPEGEIWAHTHARDRLQLLADTDYATSAVVQNSDLAAMATAVLTDAGLQPGDYFVDPALAAFAVPYAWLDKKSHRECLRIIAEACMGQVYCARDGKVMVVGKDYVPAVLPAYAITADDWWDKINPIKWSEVKNAIEVTPQPLQVKSQGTVVWSNPEAVAIGVGERVTVKAFYNEKPCVNAVASLQAGAPADCVIEAATYYAWGATVRVHSPNNAGTFKVDITADVLAVLGTEKWAVEDAASIIDNGRIVYEYPDNPLLQTRATAQAIAAALAASYKDPRKDLELDWRGNPALELGDKLSVPDSDTTLGEFWVIRQVLTWDGGLRAATNGRRA